MFDAHTKLAVPGESHFIVPMARERPRYETARGGLGQEFLADLLADEHFRRWGLEPEAVRRAFHAEQPPSYPDGIRLIYALYARAQGKPRYADKTPGYVRELPLLAELFPEARFVHIIRDGRDVVLSLMEMDWARSQAPDGIGTMAAFWKRNIESAFQARRALGPGRYHEVRYEQLVSDPEAVLKVACSFLDLPYEPGMLLYHRSAYALAGSLRQPADHRHLHMPVTAGLRDWRKEMSDEGRQTFEQVAGDCLQAAGYELSG